MNTDTNDNLYVVKTFDGDYGRHALVFHDNNTVTGRDVFAFISIHDVHPSRLYDSYQPRHKREA